MAFATLLAVSLQLDGLLMMWKFHQARQNDAIRAAFLRKRNYSLQRIHSGNLDEEFSSPAPGWKNQDLGNRARPPSPMTPSKIFQRI